MCIISPTETKERSIRCFPLKHTSKSITFTQMYGITFSILDAEYKELLGSCSLASWQNKSVFHCRISWVVYSPCTSPCNHDQIKKKKTQTLLHILFGNTCLIHASEKGLMAEPSILIFKCLSLQPYIPLVNCWSKRKFKKFNTKIIFPESCEWKVIVYKFDVLRSANVRYYDHIQAHFNSCVGG